MASNYNGFLYSELEKEARNKYSNLFSYKTDHIMPGEQELLSNGESI